MLNEAHGSTARDRGLRASPSATILFHPASAFVGVVGGRFRDQRLLSLPSSWRSRQRHLHDGEFYERRDGGLPALFVVMAACLPSPAVADARLKNLRPAGRGVLSSPTSFRNKRVLRHGGGTEAAAPHGPGREGSTTCCPGVLVLAWRLQSGYTGGAAVSHYRVSRWAQWCLEGTSSAAFLSPGAGTAARAFIVSIRATRRWEPTQATLKGRAPGRSCAYAFRGDSRIPSDLPCADPRQALSSSSPRRKRHRKAAGEKVW